ncbi:hypothetical protein Tco_0711897 [Tanacetum coccineum]
MELDSVSNWLGSDTSGCYHREERRIYVQAFVEAKLDEERFLKQKEKIKWKVADSGESSINMVKPVSDDEIKAAMFSIGDDRAPDL